MALSMFVDPGLNGTGVAIFSNIQQGKIIPPLDFNRITKPKNDGEWLLRSVDITKWVRSYMGLFKSEEWEGVYIEFPLVWSGSLVSNTAMLGGSSGEAPLLKLASLAGMIMFGALSAIPILKPDQSRRVEAKFISPGSWKGQLPKKVVIDRIRHAYAGEKLWKKPRDHEADAIGMGLAFQKGGKI